MEHGRRKDSYQVELVNVHNINTDENGNVNTDMVDDNISVNGTDYNIVKNGITSNGIVGNGTTSITNKTNSYRFRCAVLGTGNYGRALASQLYRAEIESCVGSRNQANKTCEGLEVMTYEKAIAHSDLIFLCIPAHAYKNVITPLKTTLIGKTIIEISNLDEKNQPSNALRLQNLIPSTHILKALNTVSAYTLASDSYGASRETYICGNSEEKKAVLVQVLSEIGLSPIDRGQLRSAVALEKLPFRFFPGWGTAVLITILTLVPILLYTYLRHFWYEGSDRDDNELPLHTANLTIAWLMLWLLSLTYLPGILSGFIQLFAGTKYIRFPNWLDRWMKCRKQLGLICLLLASMHACMSCLLMGSGDIKHMVKNTYIFLPGKKPIVLYQSLDARNQASLLFAVLSLAVMTVVGITSLPSVNSRMSWKEWDFMHRGLGFTSLLFGLIHVITRMYKTWDLDSKFGWKVWEKDPKGIYPFGSFVMPILPLIVIFLKIILLLPGLSCHLNKIRKGKVGNTYNGKV